MKSATNTSTLLLGGGYTLSRLASRLDPQSVIITTTTPEKASAFTRQGYQAQLAEIEDRASIEKILQRYPAITTLVDSVPPSDTTAQAIAALQPVFRHSALTKIIYLSTTGVFGVTDGSWVDEQTPPDPQHPASARRLAVEEAYRSLGIPVTALRIPAIYGPGRGIGLALRAGRYQLIEGGSDFTNRIHVDDLVRVIELSLALPDTPSLFALSDDLPAPSREVVEYYCTKFKIPHPSSISRKTALHEGRVTRLSNQRVRNDLAKRVLGLALQYPSYREGAGAEFTPE